MATVGRRYLQQRVLNRRNPRHFKKREDLFESMEDEEFRENFRLTKEAALDLVDRFKRSKYSNKTKRSHALTPKLQVYSLLSFQICDRWQFQGNLYNLRSGDWVWRGEQIFLPSRGQGGGHVFFYLSQEGVKRDGSPAEGNLSLTSLGRGQFFPDMFNIF